MVCGFGSRPTCIQSLGVEWFPMGVFFIELYDFPMLYYFGG